MKNKTLNRRNFVKFSVAAAATLPLIARADAVMPKLQEDDPTAMSLGYKEKSTEVDASKFPAHQSSQLCSGCTLYGNSEDGWGSCAIFPGKLVAGDGWCAAFAAKA